MRIAIATSGRFHVLDLARELSNLGHDVTFYSYVPGNRIARFGLPRDRCVSLLPFVFPLVALQRFGPRGLRGAANAALAWVLDWLVAWRLRPCDVFIGMAGIYLHAPMAARRRFGARIFIERGSRHIDSQTEILEQLHARGIGVERVPSFFRKRELRGYALADRIVVPSMHVERSFLERGLPAGKLFRNPYGVDLARFTPAPVPPSDRPTALFVGTWSYRKGVDVLVAAWKELRGVALLHVGPRGDAPFPNEGWFEHVDAVDQSELPRYYARAHLFVLASREEGFGMVLAQALACGLPIVCTDFSGGEDLREMFATGGQIRVVPAGNAQAFGRAVKDLLPSALEIENRYDPLGARRKELSWSAYGLRYHAHLASTCGV